MRFCRVMMCLGALGGWLGCGGSGSGSTQPQPTCTPNEQKECGCEGGARGFQTCQADGLTFSSCTSCVGGNQGSSSGGSTAQTASSSRGATGGVSQPVQGSSAPRPSSSVVSTGSPPRIDSFTADDTLTNQGYGGPNLHVTAVVSDPDGLGDLSGGLVREPQRTPRCGPSPAAWDNTASPLAGTRSRRSTTSLLEWDRPGR